MWFIWNIDASGPEKKTLKYSRDKNAKSNDHIGEEGEESTWYYVTPDLRVRLEREGEREGEDHEWDDFKTTIYSKQNPRQSKQKHISPYGYTPYLVMKYYTSAVCFLVIYGKNVSASIFPERMGITPMGKPRKTTQDLIATASQQ